jgi:hypothetical protein
LIFKYGISVTLAIAVWVALKHFVLHLEGHAAQLADLFVFNFAAIIGLVLGIKAKRSLNGGTLTFGDGWLTGILISLIYALLTSIYFMVLLKVVGPKLMQQEGETSLTKAFLGVSIAFFTFGAGFTTIIAFLLRRSQPR